MSEAGPEPLLEFLAVMRRLRAECAWKRGQTHRSLARYLLEETHETLEAIDTGDADHLREELGDLLLQVYFHAVIAEELGEFTIDDVAAGIIEKMVRRNPHVFGDVTDDDAASIDATWQAIKAAEKAGRTAPDDGLPPTLPALLLASKVLQRLDGALGGTQAPDAADAPPGVSREQGQVPGHDLGDRLLALVEEANVAGLDPEQELRDAVRRRLDRP